ncbi:MAG: ThiF family adenylyltransferase, partial [Candidatus Woesearchaeota archaeon]
MKYDKTNRYNRNIGVWSEEFQDRLKDVTVGVAGLGAGASIVPVLARNGFGNLKIADPDVFEIHNLNRQYYA